MQITDFVPLIILGPFALFCLLGLIFGVDMGQHGNTDKRPCEKHTNTKPYDENKEAA